MSSRLTRILLKLYPRRIRNRYGDELLDLQDELRSQDSVSRALLVRDAIAGAVLVRTARQRARLLIPGVIVIVGLVSAGVIVARSGGDSPLRASHPQRRPVVQIANAAPYQTCFVATGSSCSVSPCAEFVNQASVQSAVLYSTEPVTERRPAAMRARCVAYPRTQHAHAHALFVAGAVARPQP